MKNLFKLVLVFSVIIIICVLCFVKWVDFNEKKEQIPVLMYHEVVYDENYSGQPDTISLSTLKKHLKYLHDNGYKTLTLDEFYCWKIGKCKFFKKSVVLTFDDGFYSFYYLVEPELKKYNFHATNFLIGSTVNEVTNEYNSKKYGTIGKDLIKKHSKYVNYQSHSYDMHRYVNNKQRIYEMSKEELQDDIDNMSKIKKFEYISYPYNTDTDEFIKILKSNKYKLAFRGENEKAIKSDDNYKIPRIGIQEDFESFKKIFESKKYNNRYGSGFLRKVFVNIERKFKIRLR